MYIQLLYTIYRLYLCGFSDFFLLYYDPPWLIKMKVLFGLTHAFSSFINNICRFVLKKFLFVNFLGHCITQSKFICLLTKIHYASIKTFLENMFNCMQNQVKFRKLFSQPTFMSSSHHLSILLFVFIIKKMERY